MFKLSDLVALYYRDIKASKTDCVCRHGVLVGDATVSPALSVLVQHKPKTEQIRRLSASGSASSRSHEASVIASCSKSSSVDTQSMPHIDATRPQTLVECQEFIRRLEADSIKQAHEVFILTV